MPHPPLHGITVIDFTRVMSGPYCTMLLADMGARVIKIERPGRGDDTRAWGPPFINGQSTYFLSINRNKESLTLDLKAPAARNVVLTLLEKADVLVENFTPGTMDALGFGYEAMSAGFPRLVYCSISGFGQSGPRRDEPGYDAVMQAEAGLMSITGPENGEPYRLGIPIADIVTGMSAAQGIAMALIARGRSGLGQRVDVSLFDSTAALLTYQAGIQFATGDTPVRMGNRHPSIVPYETFAAADGEFVLAVGNDEQWRRFCRVIGAEHLADDERFATNGRRIEHYAELRPLLSGRLQERARQQWIVELKAAGIPCGAVRDIAEVLEDPQLEARQMIETVEHTTSGPLRVLGVPTKLSDTPGSVRTAPPTLGQHTDHILRQDCGLSSAEIAALRLSGALGQR
jgi:crotonobetainyl-CoA:carnitine CoA-transferase CaiB-like acyl-CoA transferase